MDEKGEGATTGRVPQVLLDAYIRDTRRAVTELLRWRGQAQVLRRQYDALDLGNVLDEATFTALGLTKAQFISGIVSLEALDQFLVAGHDTNFYVLILAS